MTNWRYQIPKSTQSRKLREEEENQQRFSLILESGRLIMISARAEGGKRQEHRNSADRNFQESEGMESETIMEIISPPYSFDTPIHRL
ncbi:hypothetical protein Nepgr_011105 [Nepenthes gracilis]|uniref:Uncharacterized protein n=1 Tax=Nepenthes gracilis TaxID=150966 RepID=A0AAD3SE90_NEPGR|nr:hypothetical protein Nepgr_011105 [Nepenthes gracilis]